LNFELRS